MAGVKRRRADWDDLRLFWAVAESGGFGAAARALGVSQSTLTRRVDELEQRLNARLLARTPHGVTLTEAGKLAFDRVLTMERSAEAIENLVLNTDDAAEGAVGLAVPDGIAGVLLAPALPEFLRANPKINLRFDCGLWPDHPLEGGADLSLTFCEPTHPDLIARPIAYFHYGLFAARSYLDLYGEPATLGECTAHAYVHHAAQVHQKQAWHPQSEAFRTMVEMRVETNASAVSWAAICHGAGLGLLPTAALERNPELVMLDLPRLGRLALWLCFHRDVARSARIRKVADWLAEVFDSKTKPWFREEYVAPADFRRLLAAEPPPARAPTPARRRSA